MLHELVIHELKIHPEYFEAVVLGRKRFEVRKNDRNFQCGDLLDLREFMPGEGYTGHRRRFLVTYVLRGGEFGIDPEYVVMSLLLIS